MGNSKYTRKLGAVSVVGILLVLASMLLFKNHEKNAPSSNNNELAQANLDRLTREEATANKNIKIPASGTETPKENEYGIVSLIDQPTANVGGNSYHDLSKALAQNVLSEGMSQEVVDCLVVASRDNLKLEKPLDFNGISDSCAAKYQLSKNQKAALRKAFRDSVRESSDFIDLDKWKFCMLEKHKSGGCVADLILKNVEDFYTEKSGSSPMKTDVFQNKRESEIENIFNNIMNKCPTKINELNGVFANECT